MLRRALRGDRRFVVSDWELRRKGVSYTEKTLRAFKKAHPGSSWHLLIGGDSLANFTSWRRWAWLLKESRLTVGLRRGVATTGVPPLVLNAATVLKARLPAVSSSDVRERVRGGKSISRLVPVEAARVIRRKGLYAR
jgi:nicotinate-nucleotide adenylyltransferase